MRWKIYYADGSTFSDLDGDPADAPAWGVEFILQADDLAAPESVGRLIESGSDYYLCEGQEWVGVDLVGLVDHLAEMGIVKVGRTVPSSAWREIKRRALSDPDFPEKSAWRPAEERVRNG